MCWPNLCTNDLLKPIRGFGSFDEYNSSSSSIYDFSLTDRTFAFLFLMNLCFLWTESALDGDQIWGTCAHAQTRASFWNEMAFWISGLWKLIYFGAREQINVGLVTMGIERQIWLPSWIRQILALRSTFTWRKSCSYLLKLILYFVQNIFEDYFTLVLCWGS